jgi:hypothetical protein
MLANRFAGIDRSPAPSVAGALLPDVIDKTLSWVLGVAPSARYIGHTLVMAGALSAGAAGLFGRRPALAFCGAYVVHLLGDLWDEGHVPWFMPFRRYDHRGKRWDISPSLADLALEGLGAAYLLWTAKAARR